MKSDQGIRDSMIIATLTTAMRLGHNWGDTGQIHILLPEIFRLDGSNATPVDLSHWGMHQLGVNGQNLLTSAEMAKPESGHFVARGKAQYSWYVDGDTHAISHEVQFMCRFFKTGKASQWKPHIFSLIFPGLTHSCTATPNDVTVFCQPDASVTELHEALFALYYPKLFFFGPGHQDDSRRIEGEGLDHFLRYMERISPHI